MDEYMKTLHDAVDAAASGDRQALYVAQWLLTNLRTRVDADPPQPPFGRSLPVRQCSNASR